MRCERSPSCFLLILYCSLCQTPLSDARMTSRAKSCVKTAHKIIAGFSNAVRVNGGQIFSGFWPAISRLISLLSFQILMHCIILNILTQLTLKKTKYFRRSGTFTMPLTSAQSSPNNYKAGLKQGIDLRVRY